MEDKRTKAVKSWLEPKSVQDIQVFIGFVNFYWHFIQRFSKFAAPLTSMLRRSFAANIQPQKSMVVDDKDVIGSGRLNEKSSKSKNPTFLPADARQAFT